MRLSWYAFFDELEKIAVSGTLSTYGPQSRIGRRPIRVAKAIEKDNEYWRSRRKQDAAEIQTETETPDNDDSRFYSHEGYQQYVTTPASVDDGSLLG